MISTVGEGVKRYKKMLREYVLKTERLKREYENTPFMSWGGDDYRYVVETSKALAAIEKVLNFSKREKEEFFTSAKKEIKKIFE